MLLHNNNANGPSALGWKLFYFVLSVEIKLFVNTASDGLSTNANSLVLKTGVLHTEFPQLYL